MRALIRVPLTIGTTLEFGTPTELFEGPYFYNVLERMYDVSADGRRFLMVKESRASGVAAPTSRLSVVRNWSAVLKGRAPTK